MTFLEAVRSFAGGSGPGGAVLRAAAEHDGWWVSAAGGPGRLWIFSDDERARRAAESGRVGTLEAGVPGVEVFRSLAGFTRLEINPGSPPEESFHVELDDRARAFLDLWGRAVAVERALARGTPDDEAVRAAREHGAFIAFVHADGAIVTVPGQLGVANGAAVFTAPDCAAAFEARLPEATLASLRRVTLDGARLFASIARAGVDGVVVNAFGPAPAAALPLEACARIAAG